MNDRIQKVKFHIKIQYTTHNREKKKNLFFFQKKKEKLIQNQNRLQEEMSQERGRKNCCKERTS